MIVPHQWAPLGRIALRIADSHQTNVDRAIEEALSQGLTVELIAEAILQGIPYSGFPGAVEALGSLRKLTGTLATDDADPREPDRHDPPTSFCTVYGAQVEAVRASLTTLHPQLERWILNFAYGDVMERGKLPFPLVEGLAVASLIGQRRRTPLHSHLRGALRAGWSQEQLESWLELIEADADRPTIEFARQIIRREA